MVFRILDATSFYAGIPFASQEQSFTTPLIYEEIKHIKKNHDAVQVLIDLNRLQIIEPEKKFTNIILEKAQKTGDLVKLSKEDISVLALSLQLNGELITDDYSVSNVAKELKLKVTPIMTKGISKIVNTRYICTACKRTFEKVSECPICGTRLKKSVIKKLQ